MRRVVITGMAPICALGSNHEELFQNLCDKKRVIERIDKNTPARKKIRASWYVPYPNLEDDLFREKLAQLELGLEDRMDHPVGLLSGGQRQALTLLMAALQQPKLLLLDEHTAALDPKTAAKVLEATQRIVEKNHLTTMMITHNMRDAIHYGNRLLMLHNGRIVLDISGEEKARLTVPDLLALFSKVSGQEYDNDRALLA